MNIVRLSPIPSNKSPSPNTDYRKKTTVKETTCFHAWTMLNNGGRSSPLLTCIVILSTLLTALMGLTIFFTSHRDLDIRLSDLSTKKLHFCRSLSEVNVRIDGLKTRYSILNLNYFPVFLKEARFTIALRNENKTRPLKYQFEVNQAVRQECQGKSFCTDVGASVQTIEVKVGRVTNIQSCILEQRCRSDALSFEVVVKAYQYIFLWNIRTMKSLGVKKIFSAPCTECNG